MTTFMLFLIATVAVFHEERPNEEVLWAYAICIVLAMISDGLFLYFHFLK